MFLVYLLRNKFNRRKLYIGFTEQDVYARLKDHNYGKVAFTSWNKPWELIYYEAYLDEKNARLREKQLKQYGSAWGHLKKRIGL